MKIYLKTPEQIERIRKAGRIAARVLRTCAEAIEPNRTTDVELDRLAEQLTLELGGFPAFKGYRLFPSTLCVSINEEVVHGLPSGRVLRSGDLVTLDIGVYYEGFCCDTAITVIVGHTDYQRKRLVRVTEEALYKALEVARAGNTTGDIGAAVQRHAEAHGFKPAKGLAGHGVGRFVHEQPDVPNTGEPGKGVVLKPGMVLAIEPMLVMGDPEVEFAENEWSIVTRDRKPAAHFEHTVAITENGVDVLTVE
ncbi:MAG: type I methionyl aminopeptidase [Fimbriimonadales bacterium]|nr:type I methionyl aminopeptidase [Fimbriimonadales bacterium]MDW8052229.1 type I methionyl aminopeptidase [Armatimonadota bacterium]